ncbi:hypothetical protein GOP47_0023127 [Adiantum capillus-veneris]|uniref:Receptor-like serine/threonine-protein kinase n=1 Tax=Adiantum capillus-veneris TaxID=13818 RepID=A0A9D4Z4Y3_ADICA|nr:hypothetical protein GOP47_0023127 [Adiantum capillus-veneris]
MGNLWKQRVAVLSAIIAYAVVGDAASNLTSSAQLNTTFTIASSDYELQTSLIDILVSPNATFQLKFGNLPGQSNAHSLGIVHLVSSTLVWYTYRDNNPGQYDNLGGFSTSLRLQADGDLVISIGGQDGSDLIIWRTSTTTALVRSMELRDNGNLVLLDSTNDVVWQSFDYPTDTLLSTQKLRVGKSLLNSARNGFPSVGRSVLAMEAHRLVAYVNYESSEPYWELRPSSNNTEVAYAEIANASISIFDTGGNILGSRGSSSSSGGEGPSILQRFLLDLDGNMRLFQYDNSSSRWVSQMQVIEEACALPDDCGSYGLCIPGQGCACPPTFKLLATLNGCVPPRGLVCNSKHSNDFVKITAASYFATEISSDTVSGLSLDECKDLCTRNCSCLGFFYGAAPDLKARGNCLVTSQMRTLSASVFGNYTNNYMYDAYVRVQGKPRSPLAIILGVCVPVVVIVFCIALWWFVRHKVKVAHAEEEEFLLEALPGLPPRYSYRELKNATENFTRRMGGGSFGSVYEGILADGTKIAVKQLEGISQGKKEFHAEVATIGTVRHLNLVRLRGFCLERHHRLLVYEHLGRGSLDALLFPKEGSENLKLSWAERLAIAIGVARGLAYLHEGSPDCIVHCDIKPENILVDDDGVAKLSDFGLAKLMSRQQDVVETIVRGTRGYMAPEWLRMAGRITEKADVYSYGVTLLELLSGRRNFEGTPESRWGYMPEWALYNLRSGGEGRAEEILDEVIVEEKDPSAKRALMVAVWCLQEDPTVRPAMSRVVQMLEGLVDVPLPPPPLMPSPTGEASVSSQFSAKAFEMHRFANSEVTMPFLRRASRFFSSSTFTSTSTSPAVASSVY